MTTATHTLTIAHVNQLRVILEAAERSAHVTFIAPDDSPGSGRIMGGTARHIVRGAHPSEWVFMRGDYDVRDAYLRITLDNGFDVAYAVRALMGSVADGEFVIDEEKSRR